MALTVRDVLALEVVSNAEASVVAGEEALDRQVRWVHVSELPDIARLFSGGELLLTTALALSRDPDDLARFVDELSAAGVVGVVIELGRRFRELPEPLVAAARRRRLPLIALHREARYVDVTEEVLGAIVNEQYRLLRDAETVRRRFTDLALAGADLGIIVDTLASMVENPVIFEDASHQVVEFRSHARPRVEILPQWERHTSEPHAHGHAADATRELGTDPPCAWMSVFLRQEVWGSLHILEHDTPITELDLIALDRCATTIGMTLLAERSADVLADRARSGLIFDLRQGRYAGPDEFHRRARSLGADFRGMQLAVLVVDLPGIPALVEQQELSEQERHKLSLRALQEVRQAAGAAGVVNIAAVEGHKVVAVVGVRGRSLHDVADALATDVCERLRRTLQLSAYLGISRPADAQALRRGFEEAQEASSYSARIARRPGLHHFGELGIHQLLLPLLGRPELPRYVEAELAPLIARDRGSSSPLLPTLRAYVMNSGRKAETARQLHVERRTLYHRIERIEQILGRSLSDHETITRLAFAFHGLDLLGRNGPPAAEL